MTTTKTTWRAGKDGPLPRGVHPGPMGTILEKGQYCTVIEKDPEPPGFWRAKIHRVRNGMARLVHTDDGHSSREAAIRVADAFMQQPPRKLR